MSLSPTLRPPPDDQEPIISVAAAPADPNDLTTVFATAAPPAASGRPASDPPAVVMTPAKWVRLFERLRDKDYYDFSLQLPGGGEKALLECLHRRLCEDDSTWQLNPLSAHGKRQAAGEAHQGGLFLRERVSRPPSRTARHPAAACNPTRVPFHMCPTWRPDVVWLHVS